MADNITIKDASGSNVVIATKDLTSVQHHKTIITDSSGNLIDFETPVAHDAVDSGKPVKIGARAIASQSGLTLVAAADRTDLLAGVDGFLLTRPDTNLEDIVVGNASNTDGTSTECIAAAGSGVKIYLRGVTLTNTSATAIYVELKSGTTVRWRFPVPANTSGVVYNFFTPLPPNAANEAWNFDPSAAATTVYCSMIGFKSEV